MAAYLYPSPFFWRFGRSSYHLWVLVISHLSVVTPVESGNDTNTQRRTTTLLYSTLLVLRNRVISLRTRLHGLVAMWCKQYMQNYLRVAGKVNEVPLVEVPPSIPCPGVSKEEWRAVYEWMFSGNNGKSSFATSLLCL